MKLTFKLILICLKKNMVIYISKTIFIYKCDYNGADQIRGNCAADQRLVWATQITIPLFPEFEIVSL